MSSVAAARAIRKADDGIATWLKDLVTGAGSSPSHIIITGVLGVIPGLGQVMDARDIILSVIQIAKTPAMIGGWVELVITLIGCVPAVGDALKVGFKLMKQGHNFGRVLEGVTPAVRGNVEKYMRKIDWGMLTKESKSLFDNVINAFIDGLDSWVVKAIGGRNEVKMVIEELRAVQKSGSKMIDQAFAELKAMHGKMMGHELPRSTAAVGGTSAPRKITSHAADSARPALTPIQQARVERKLAAKRSADAKANRVSANSTNNSTKKNAKRKKQDFKSGIPAEHITDYCMRRKHTNFRKANNGGRLTEEWDKTHQGIDHLWANKTSSKKPFVVGETKSSLIDSFKLIKALPSDLQSAFETLRANEAQDRTPNDQPNIFHSEGRDAHANKRVEMGTENGEENELKKGLGKPKKIAMQMSHEWIRDRVMHENLTASGIPIKAMVQLYRLQRKKPGAVAPYQRWVSLVTGRQTHKHQQSGGRTHEVQITLDLPDNILER